MSRVTTQVVTVANFEDLARLMEAPGGPHACWCMAFRDKPREDKTLPAATRKEWRKALLQTRVEAGLQVGILAYDGDVPVGWCSTGPLDGFRRLGGPKVDAPGQVWAISCFFIPRPRRGKGVMRLLVNAAIREARAAGAEELRASPVVPDAPAYRFQGFLPLFKALGFEEISMAGHGRHIVRLPLG